MNNIFVYVCSIYLLHMHYVCSEKVILGSVYATWGPVYDPAYIRVPARYQIPTLNWLHDCHEYNGDTSIACDPLFEDFFAYNEDPAISNAVSFTELFRDFKYFVHQWGGIDAMTTLGTSNKPNTITLNVDPISFSFTGGSGYQCNPAFNSVHSTCYMKSYNTHTYDDLFDKKCNVCIPSTSSGICQAGMYATTPMPSSSLETGSPYGVSTCTPCVAGTWLTCKSGTSTYPNICSYPVQRTVWTGSYFQMMTSVRFQAPRGFFTDLSWANESIGTWVRNVVLQNSDINILPQLGTLVGQCYPCRYAANVAHYGVTANAGADLIEKGWLPFKCMGGAAAPEPCPNKPPDIQVAVMDERGWASRCQCKDGYYSNFTGGPCERCPAGSYCAIDMKNSPYWTQKLPCPKYYYSLAGASICTKCNTDSASCCPSGVKDCGLVRTACLADFQDKDSRCIDCTSCRELDPQGEAPCFGIYNAVGVGAGN